MGWAGSPSSCTVRLTELSKAAQGVCLRTDPWVALCYSSSPDTQLLQLSFLVAICLPLPGIILTQLIPIFSFLKWKAQRKCCIWNLCSANTAVGFVPCPAGPTTKQGHNSQSPSPNTWRRQLSFCFSLNLARAGAFISSTEESIFHSPERYSVKVLSLCYFSRISCMDGILVRWRNSHDEQLLVLQLPQLSCPLPQLAGAPQEPEMRSENIQGSHGGL